MAPTLLFSGASQVNPSAYLGLSGRLSEMQSLSIQCSIINSIGDDPNPTGMPGFDVIIDSGCSVSVSSFESDFESGSLKALPRPIMMNGIAGCPQAVGEGTLRYEIISDSNEVSVIRCPGFLMKELPVRLLSSQQLLDQPGHEEGLFGISRSKGAKLKLKGRSLNVGYQHGTNLPAIRAHHNVQKDAVSLLSSSPALSDSSNKISRLRSKSFLTCIVAGTISP